MNIATHLARITFFVLFLNFTSFAQEEVPDSLVNVRRHNLKPFYIKNNIKKKDRLAVNYFNYFEVKDVRFNKSWMGFVKIDPKTKMKLVFPESSDYLKSKLNESIIPAAVPDTLVIVLNDLWFNEMSSESSSNSQTVTNYEHTLCKCYLNVDFYIRRDGVFINIGSIDTVFSDRGWLPTRCDELFTNAIKEIVLAGDDFSYYKKERGISYAVDQFDSANLKKFEYPIVNQRPVKGIYFSYEEFLNNNPSQQSFTVKEIGKVRRISYKASNDTTPDLAWGFCDGKKFFIRLEKGYYELKSLQSGFEVTAPQTQVNLTSIGSKILTGLVETMVVGGPPTSFLTPAKQESILNRVYFLNILNGTLRISP